MSANTVSGLSNEDQFRAYLLGHLRVIEATLMALWNQHPDREHIEAQVRIMSEAATAFDLAGLTTDDEVNAKLQGRQAALDAIFHALPQATPSESGRTA